MFSVSEAASRLGVCPKTIRRWHNSGRLHCHRTLGGHRRITAAELQRLLALRAPSASSRSHRSAPQQHDATGTTMTITTTVAIYARVSSHRQARDGDLLRQQELLVKAVRARNGVDPMVFTDIGSGLNMRRRGLLRLLRTARRGLLHTVVVTHRDRLARFAVSLIERLLADHGVHLLVLCEEAPEHRTPQEELVADLLALIASFSGRVYGLRAAALRSRRGASGTASA
ncbi:MAG: IS607 family transposase [Candidatus Thorarchaeota archaeon]|nr:IS607 family transposase [Candidatus Thorarchaeota archaeon]